MVTDVSTNYESITIKTGSEPLLHLYNFLFEKKILVGFFFLGYT